MMCRYCSKECQTESWPGHKKQCKRAKRERADASGSELRDEMSEGRWLIGEEYGFMRQSVWSCVEIG